MHDVSKRLYQTHLRDDAVERMHNARILIELQIFALRGAGDGCDVGDFRVGEVQGHDVERCLWLFGGSGLLLGHHEVVDHRDAAGPGCAEDFIPFAVHKAKFETRAALFEGHRFELRDGFVPHIINTPTFAITSLIPTRQVNHPFLVDVRLGRELSLPVADVDLLDYAAGDDVCSGIDGVGNRWTRADQGLGSLKEASRLVEEGLLPSN